MLFSHKKGRNPIPPFMITCMDFEGIMLNEISQGETHHSGILLKKKKKSTKLNDTENKLVFARSGEWEN